MLVESFGEAEEDDETASTVSYCTGTDVSMEEEEEEEDLLFSSERSTAAKKKSVSFAPQLVTHVHTRPATTAADKYYLHYSDVDYLDFKIGFLTGRDRTRKVSFARDVVSKVKDIPDLDPRTKHALFYSEPELQRYVSKT